MKIVLILITCLLISSACSHLGLTKTPSTQKNLQRSVSNVINDAFLKPAQIGIYIELLNNGEILYDLNSEKLFIPASNQKLFTSAVALEELGPDFQFRTEFYKEGEIRDSTLFGNLIIRGMGDPSISGEYSDEDVLAIFRQWCDSLLMHGIKNIAGEIIGNEGYFTDEQLGSGWMWDDEPFHFSALSSALSYNENCINITVLSGEKSGDSLLIITDPESDYVVINNNAITVHADSGSTLKITRQRAENIITVSGEMPSDQIKEELVTIENPSLWFLNVFTKVLKEKNITFSGKLKTDKKIFQNLNRNKIFTHKSPPLKELLKTLNFESNNFYAEQIFKTLAAVKKGQGNAEKAREVFYECLSNWGVDKNQYIPVDGSGLSRYNLTTPLAIAQVLRYMYKSPFFEDFTNSLPIAGVKGTLEKRMSGTVAQGVLKAKTGYVKYSRNLSGYTKDRKGNDYLFVFMFNNYTVSTSIINGLQDKIAVLLTEYSPK